MLNEKRALARITNAQYAMYDWRRKIYRLRRIVAGDKDALVSQAVGQNRDIGQSHARPHRDDTPDILMAEFEEGRNNDLLNGLGTLVEQTVYSFPSIDIRNLIPHQQAVNQQWFSDRAKACNATHHNKIAIWDYLMGGMGDFYIPIENGKPVVRWADSLDIKFDQTARLVCDVKWKSITVVDTLEHWIRLFGRDQFTEYLQGKSDDDQQAGMDLPFELEFYYDADPEYNDDGSIKNKFGNYMVFVKTSRDGYKEKPVYKGTNPSFFTRGSEKVAFLPFESLFFNTLPSVRLPSGIAEKALPAQIAVWRAAKRIQEIIDRGPAFYETEEGIFESEEAEEGFKQGLIAGIVKVKAGEIGKIKEHQPLKIDQTDVEELARNTESLKRQLGVSNYSSGAAEGNVKFAREVNAIQADGALTAGSIAKDNAEFWGRWAPKFFAKGQAWDKEYFLSRIDGVELVFGAENPIGQYLVPEAEMRFSEDSMRFVPMQTKVAQMQGVLEESAKLGAAFPNAVEPAFRDYLKANGIEDVDERLKQPAPTPPVPGMPVPAPSGAPIPGQVPQPA